MNSADPNRVFSDGTGCTTTPLERTTDAYVAALYAACYPGDALVRHTAIELCATLDINYIEAVAQVTTSMPAIREQQGDARTDGDLADDMDEARWRIAAHLGSLIGQHRNAGAMTRRDILRTGMPAGPLGLGEPDDDDDLETA